MSISLKVGEIDPPSVIMDVVNLPDPVYLGFTITAYNNDDVGLYFQITGSGTGWTFITVNLGLIGAGGSLQQNLDNFCHRARPASETSEQIQLILRAYTDAGYSNLKWTYTKTLDVLWIKSDDGSWTQNVLNNFDDGTVKGWAVANICGNDSGYPVIAVVSDFFLSPPYAVRMAERMNSAHTSFQQFVVVSFAGVDIVVLGSGYTAYPCPGQTGCVSGDPSNHMVINKWMRTIITLTPNVTNEVALRNVMISGYFSMGNWGCGTVRSKLYKSFTTPNKATVYAIMDIRLTNSGAEARLTMDDFRIISKD